jgi:hypothetical protein
LNSLSTGRFNFFSTPPSTFPSESRVPLEIPSAFQPFLPTVLWGSIFPFGAVEFNPFSLENTLNINPKK